MAETENTAKRVTGMWGFTVKVTAPDLKGNRADHFPGHFFGSAVQAETKAHQLRADMISRAPDGSTVDVTAVLIAEVAPLVLRDIEGLIDSMQQEQVLARYLAARLAMYAARESLEIKPDINIIAEGLLAQGRVQVERARAAAANARPGLLVDGSGRRVGRT